MFKAKKTSSWHETMSLNMYSQLMIETEGQPHPQGLLHFSKWLPTSCHRQEAKKALEQGWQKLYEDSDIWLDPMTGQTTFLHLQCCN